MYFLNIFNVSRSRNFLRLKENDTYQEQRSQVKVAKEIMEIKLNVINLFILYHLKATKEIPE